MGEDADVQTGDNLLCAIDVGKVEHLAVEWVQDKAGDIGILQQAVQGVCPIEAVLGDHGSSVMEIQEFKEQEGLGHLIS